MFISIPHDGTVNRARFMPQNAFMIATKSSTGKVLLFDYSKHSSEPESVSRIGEVKCRPQLTMTGHEEEGYGLCWNPRQMGHLASSGADGKICLYDINRRTDSERTVEVCDIGKAFSIDDAL